MTGWLSAYYEQLVTNYRILLENPSACPAVGYLQLLSALLVASVLLRLALHCLVLIGLRLKGRRLEPRFSSLARAYERCSRRVGLRRKPRLYLQPQASPAFATGLVRGDVFVSPALIDQLSPAELEAMLTHELVHVRRCDHLRVWAWELGAAMLPAAVVQVFGLGFVFGEVESWVAVGGATGGYLLLRFVLWGRLRHRREHTCDDRTVELTGDPLALASSLLKACRVKESSRPLDLVAASPLVGAASPVERRIARLIDYRRPTVSLVLGRIGGLATASIVLLFALFVGSVHWSGLADAELAVACTLSGEQTLVMIPN